MMIFSQETERDEMLIKVDTALDTTPAPEPVLRKTVKKQKKVKRPKSNKTRPISGIVSRAYIKPKQTAKLGS
jgi:hypothetical protein